MTSTCRHVLVYVTVPNRRTARRMARSILEQRLAACVGLVPSVESHYWWEGSIQTGKEILLLIKTTKRSLPALETNVKSLHPYQTPEFVVVPFSAGSKPYLVWMDACTRSA